MSAEPKVFVLLRRLLGRPGAISPHETVGECEMAALTVAGEIARTHGNAEVVGVIAGQKRREAKTANLALARGAHRVLHVSGRGIAALDYLGTARVLAATIATHGPALAIVCGDRSGDRASGSIGPAVAELLGLEHLAGIIDLEPAVEPVATISSGGMLHRISVPLPTVLCVRSYSHEVPTPRRGEHGVLDINLRDLGLSSTFLKRYRAVREEPAKRDESMDSGMSVDDLIHRLRGFQSR